jgi:hypothetical protein
MEGRMKRSLLAAVFLSFGLAACQSQGSGSSAQAPPAAEPTPAGSTGGASADQPAPAPAGTRAASAPAAAPAPAARPAPVATPAPTPRPTPPPIVVAAGTELPIVLKSALSTKTAQAEDRVAASLADDVVVEGKVALPAGSEVRGHVLTAERSGRVKGRAHLVVSFDEIGVGGRTYAIRATHIDVTAGSSAGKDAKIAGGAAAAGVVIGAIAGGGSGAAKGGLIGGAAGGAAVLATRGKEVELEAGSRYRLELRSSLRLD